MENQSAIDQIKNFYLSECIDKFTKVEEYESHSIYFDNSQTSSYFASTTEFGVGSTLNLLEFIYRKKGEEDILLLKLRISYICGAESMDSPNILKDASMIFLVDDDPIEITEITQYDFGENEFAGFEEITILQLGLDKFIQICMGKEVEYRVIGSKGILAESKFSEMELYRIKGFYNALFDNDFEQEKLLEMIKKEKEKEEIEENDRRKKEENEKKRKEAKEKRLLEEEKRSENFKQWMWGIVFVVLLVLFKTCK